MKVLTAQQMARLDYLSIHKHKIPARRLMKNAAQACVDTLVPKMEGDNSSPVVVICGPGNNGGDGFAMTHLLRKGGRGVFCFFMGKPEKLSPEARYFLEKLDPPPHHLGPAGSLAPLQQTLRKAAWVVDALFGTGLDRPLKGRYAQVISLMNRSRANILAVDMPSGISGDTGEVLGKAVLAHTTVTFQVPKWGQLRPGAWDYVGELVVKPIGLKLSELKKMSAKAEWVEQGMVRKFFAPRSRHVHKGSAGKVLVVAGSATMPGAGYLCALAALRSGAGLVTWAMPEEAFRGIDLRHPEVILRAFPSKEGKFALLPAMELHKTLREFGALALGPGWGRGGRLKDFLNTILLAPPRPLVLDADALNLIAAHPSFLKRLRGAVLTPHPKEMSRLCGVKMKDLMAAREEVAGDFAKRHGLWLVLKGYRTVVASPQGEIFFNSTGGPNLAVAGSGDVLTGMIASLLAQGKNKRAAVLAGVYLHGRAGDRLARKRGDRGTLASELANEIPEAITELIHG